MADFEEGDNALPALDLISWLESSNFSTPSIGNYSGDFLSLLTQNVSRTSLAEQPSKLIALGVSGISLLVNMCSLLAITRVQGLLSANHRLLVSLCLSDMLVSTCVLLFNIDLAPLHSTGYDTCLFVGRRSLKMTSHLISLLNLIGLACDHYLAIVRPLNYMSAMCPKKTNLMICLFWLLAGVIGFSDFFVPFLRFSYCDKHNETMTYCENVWCAAYDSEYIVIIMAFVLLITMCCIYLRIYQQIRKYINFEGRHQRFVQRSRRALCTTLLVVGTFMICWLPYCIFEVTITFQMFFKANVMDSVRYFQLVYKLDFYLYDLLLMNCLLDPIIYAFRMREVRKGYKRWLVCLKEKPERRLVIKFTTGNSPRGREEKTTPDSRTERSATQLIVVKDTRLKDGIVQTAVYCPRHHGNNNGNYGDQDNMYVSISGDTKQSCSL